MSVSRGQRTGQYNRPADKRTPSKSTSRDFLSMSNVYPGSGSKLHPRQSLRTPQQHLPLKLEDRVNNRRASNSFIVMDPSDLDTPRTHIEAFMGATDSVPKVKLSSLRSATKRLRPTQEKTTGEEHRSVFKAPRLKELVCAASFERRRMSSPGSKFTPRTNVWNLLQTGEEKTPTERTVNLTEPSSSKPQNLTSVQNAGQRVSVSPIEVSHLRTEERESRQHSRAAKRRPFHLSSVNMATEDDLQPITNSGQRVSVSPINVSDQRSENEDFNLHKPKLSRRSFHLNVVQGDKNENPMDDSSNLNLSEEDVDERDTEYHQDRRDSDGEATEKNPNGRGVDREATENGPDERDMDEDVTNSHPKSRNVDGEATENNPNGENQSTQAGLTHQTSLEHSTRDIGPTTDNLSLQRKSSISIHAISIGGRLSTSAKQQIKSPDEYNKNEDMPDTLVEQEVEGNIGALEENFRNIRQGQAGSSGFEKFPVHAVHVQTDAQSQESFRRPSQSEDSVEGEENPQEEPENWTTIDGLKTRGKEKLNKIVLRPEREDEEKRQENINSNHRNETSPSVFVDPAQVYDLPDKSSSSSLESSYRDVKNSKESNSRKKLLSSEKRKTQGGNAASAPSSQRPPSSKRKRLNFSELKVTETEQFGSPLQRISHNSPRSSTPLNRSRRFFNSSKIQRSVSEFFQGNQDLAPASSAITPRAKSLFSKISPIRPSQEYRGSVAAHEDIAGDDNENFINRDAAKKTSEDIENIGRGQSSDEDLPDFSSLVTPHIDLRKRVFVSSLHRKSQSVNRPQVEKVQRNAVKNTQPKEAPNKRSKKLAATTLPRRTVKYFAELHSDMKLSNDAIDELETVSERFWTDSFKAVEAYALHAGRKTVQDADVILLMKTQRLISDTADLHHKIRKFLPMHMEKELIPCAYRSQHPK